MDATYWALTDSSGDVPDQPIVILKGEGPIIYSWAPHLNKWVESPIYFDEVYGGDPGRVEITEQQAAEYRAQGIGLDEEGFNDMLTWKPPPRT
jgi:hypothetical protein